MTLKEWIDHQPKMRTIDALDMIWKGWCQDQSCPNHPWYGAKPGAKIRIKLPDPQQTYTVNAKLIDKLMRAVHNEAVAQCAREIEGHPGLSNDEKRIAAAAILALKDKR